MQQVVGMCSFEATKSTKGASKLRRDLINAEIANLRDLLPLPSSTRQRLSQLQLMALVCVYVRKSNYFQQIFKRYPEMGHLYGLPNIGFSKALSGFLIMMTQNGKLLYISDNAAEYLGHSMEDLLIHGDSAYDIIDKADHGTVQAELLRSSNAHNPPGMDTRLFLCRINVSRNARRQMRFGDQKVVLVEGHYLPYQLPLCSRNEPVFVAMCTPVAMPETRECVVQGATNVFTSIHAIDMKFMHIDRNGEYYLGYTRSELAGMSWYQLIHWNYMREAQSKHRLICQSEQEKSCILLLRLEARNGEWIWVHCVLQVKDGTDAPQSQQSVIVATNQVLSEREAAVMRANSWIYHYYTVQTKLQYGLAYAETQGGGAAMTGTPASAAVAARLAAAAAYFPTTKNMMSNGQSAGYNFYHQTGHPAISPDSSGGYSPMPLHSPHPNGLYNATLHSYDLRNGKESPLDFSLAASSPYEFPGGYPSASYWSTHPHYHAGYVAAAARGEEGSTVLSTISASTPSPYSWSSLPGATTLSASTNGTQSQNHHNNHHHHHHHNHHQQPIHHQASSNTPNTNTTAATSPSSTLGLSKRAKRIKKNVESESDLSSSGPTDASAAVSHTLDTESRLLRTYSSSSNGTEVMTLTATPFTHHIRPRKLLLGGSTEENVTVVEEESIPMALTPSPVWEGQTHRVPDLQLYNSASERSQSDSNPATSNSSSSSNNVPDLAHRVPTMELWNHAPAYGQHRQRGGLMPAVRSSNSQRPPLH